MITRRNWVAAIMLSFLTTGCANAGRRQLTIGSVLAVLPTLRSEDELVRQVAPPTEAWVFNPGDKNDKRVVNRLSREDWKDIFESSSPTLIDTLPLGTRMLLYNFRFLPDHSGVDLVVFVDDAGQILGWLYSKSYKGRESSFLVSH